MRPIALHFGAIVAAASLAAAGELAETGLRCRRRLWRQPCTGRTRSGLSLTFRDWRSRRLMPAQVEHHTVGHRWAEGRLQAAVGRAEGDQDHHRQDQEVQVLAVGTGDRPVDHLPDQERRPQAGQRGEDDGGQVCPDQVAVKAGRVPERASEWAKPLVSVWPAAVRAALRKFGSPVSSAPAYCRCPER